jgi:[ribosomal protein S18]-alanine N-acetyltransferase
VSGEPITIEPMTVGDLPEVLVLERASFPTPWTEANFRHEIEDNPLAWNLVAKIGGGVAGFACAYVVADEVMINDLAVDERKRRRGVGSAMLRRLLDGARSRGCRRATLEVRLGNGPARALYESFGFTISGLRRGYYADTGEDALLLSFDLGERRG